MSYRIAGIDVHKKMLAVARADVEVDGDLGPVSADMRLQFIAIVGYAGVLPTVSLLSMLVFRRTQT